MEIERAAQILETGCDMPTIAHSADELDESLKMGAAALRAQVEREKAPETNLERHFGTPERAADTISQIEDTGLNFCKNKPECTKAMEIGDITLDDCRACLIDWLNTPAEDEE